MSERPRCGYCGAVIIGRAAAARYCNYAHRRKAIDMRAASRKLAKRKDSERMRRMFDRVVVVPERSRTGYVTKYVEVTEKRAPTDESVKLLREMEAKAQANVIEQVRLTDNDFECVVQIVRDFANNEPVARAIFSLNGERMTAEYRGKHDTDLPGLLNGLQGKVAHVIAVNGVGRAFRKVMS